MHPFPRLKALLALLSLSTAVACAAHTTKNERQAETSAAAVTMAITLDDGGPSWSIVDVAMQRLDGDKAAVRRTFKSGDFAAKSIKDLTLEVPQGLYTIALLFKDDSGKGVYKECNGASLQQYKVLAKEFRTSVPVCQVDKAVPAGKVDVTPNSSVTINPVAGSES